MLSADCHYEWSNASTRRNLAGCGGDSRPDRAREGPGPLPTLLSPHPHRVPSRRCPSRRRDTSALSMTCGLRAALRPDVILSDDAIVSGATPLREGTLRGAVGTAGRIALGKALARYQRFSPPIPTGCLRGDVRPVEETPRRSA